MSSIVKKFMSKRKWERKVKIVLNSMTSNHLNRDTFCPTNNENIGKLINYMTKLNISTVIFFLIF